MIKYYIWLWTKISDIYLNSEKKDEYEKSELINDLKDILNVYGFKIDNNNKIKTKIPIVYVNKKYFDNLSYLSFSKYFFCLKNNIG